MALVVGLVVAALPARAHAQKNDGQTQVVTLKVSGMTCGGCEAAVKMAAKKIDGVKDVKASSDHGTAEVRFDTSKTSAEAIAAAITKYSGFKAEAPKTAKNKK
ncbi:MAG: heavy-metal-associated domain-containing protein [Acidobacteria bacterium]|nr:heavy-metal-associated domain-containing protein [Acidobacteriota bacterium]